jgi:mRNA interferase HigB
MMRVIAKRTVKAFWEQPRHSDAQTPLIEWYNMLLKATWATPNELKADIATASILKGGRVVFNIGGNKYRVIVAIRYDKQIAWVRFIGTHAQYDEVDAETI